MARVLLIDDDIELGELATEFLGLEGFEVETVRRGDTGSDRAINETFDIIVLDVMLPGLGGFEVLRRIRSHSAVPVLMLTARGQAVDRIVGLEVGADDYLSKPFDERELVARMRAILRRSGGGRPKEAATSTPGREMLGLADIEIDLGARVARCGAAPLILTGVEFDLLVLLVRGAGGVVSREQITRDVLDRKLVAFDRSVDTHISRLRRKLGPHPGGEERIKTIRGYGYIYTLPPQLPGGAAGNGA